MLVSKFRFVVACRFTRHAHPARILNVRHATVMSGVHKDESLNPDYSKHGQKDKRNRGENSNTSPRKRRHITKDGSSGSMETQTKETPNSPIKTALRERKHPPAFVIENTSGLNNAPCFVRTGISLNQLFSLTGGQFQTLDPRFAQKRDFSTCQFSNSIQSSSVLNVPNTSQYRPVPEDDTKGEFHDPVIADRLAIPRAWEYTGFGIAHEQHRQSGMEFTVMSYNVLAQKLLEDHGYLYTGSQAEALQWQYRREVLLGEISSHSPDVMCLQEVQEDHFEDFFKPHLENLGYEGVYQKRTGDKCDGCAVFYKQDKFSLSRTVPVEYCRGGMMDRDNIALILELTPKSNLYSGSVEKMFVANTHLLFNPRRGDIKLGQLMILLAELDRFARSANPSGYAPVILCGDFNCEPQSEIYKFVVRGYLKYKGLIARFLSGQKEGQYGRDVYLRKHFFCKSFGITDQCQYQETLQPKSKESPSSLASDEEAASRDSKTEPDVGTSQKCASPQTSGSSQEVPREHTKLPHDAFDHTIPVHDTQSEHPVHLSPLGTSYGFSTSPSDFNNSSMQSGQLWHRLNFVSTYNHTIARLNHQWEEVTTQHDGGACSVDYIFYNVGHKEVKTRKNKIEARNVREGKLRLLKRYGLMSQKEIAKLGGLPNPLCPSDHVPLLSTFLLQN